MKKTEKSNTNEIIEIPAEEAPYALPDGWKWVRLGDFSTSQYGYSAKAVDDDKLPKMLRITDIQDNGVDWKTVPGCNIEDSKLAQYRLVDNDIVIARIGATTGKSFLIDKPPLNAVFASYLIRVRLSKDLLPKYVYFFLQSETYWKQISDLSSGIALPGVNSTKLQTMMFPLPPLETQKHIVDRIESLFAKLDEAKEKAQTALDTFELRKSAILHKAFTGELTAKWRSSCRPSDISSAPAHIESAPADISSSAPAEHIDNDASITAEHFVNISSVPNSLSPKQSYSGPAEQALPNSSLPNGWLKKCFADVANIKLNLVEPSDYPNYPHIAPDSIEKKTGVLLTYRTVAEDKVTSAKHRFYPGQILYSKIRPYLSKVVIIDFDGLCSADMYPIEAVENTRFLWYYMLSDEFLNQASNAGSRTVLPKINQKELAKISVSLPPLPEQQEIVRILDNLLAKENAAKEAAEAVIDKIDLMKKSILARAFRGEL